MALRLAQQVEEVVAEVRSMGRGRSGRLAAVTLAVPEQLGPEAVLDAVRTSLVQAGATDVEVAARATTGPLRVLSVEFQR